MIIRKVWQGWTWAVIEALRRAFSQNQAYGEKKFWILKLCITALGKSGHIVYLKSESVAVHFELSIMKREM